MCSYIQNESFYAYCSASMCERVEWWMKLVYVLITFPGGYVILCILKVVSLFSKFMLNK